MWQPKLWYKFVEEFCCSCLSGFGSCSICLTEFRKMVGYKENVLKPTLTFVQFQEVYTYQFERIRWFNGYERCCLWNVWTFANNTFTFLTYVVLNITAHIWPIVALTAQPFDTIRPKMAHFLMQLDDDQIMELLGENQLFLLTLRSSSNEQSIFNFHQWILFKQNLGLPGPGTGVYLLLVLILHDFENWTDDTIFNLSST